MTSLQPEIFSSMSLDYYNSSFGVVLGNLAYGVDVCCRADIQAQIVGIHVFEYFLCTQKKMDCVSERTRTHIAHMYLKTFLNITSVLNAFFCNGLENYYTKIHRNS